MKRVMCIWLPNWAVQRCRAGVLERGGQGARPLLLYRSAARGPVVAACSERAARTGVVLGMPLAEAVAVLQQYAPVARSGQQRMEPQIEPYRADRDRDGLRALARSFQCFSPLVGVDDCPEPDSLLLDITGCAHLFGGEYALAGHVVHDLFQRGLFARVATADTVGAAWAVAHAGCWSRTEQYTEAAQHTEAAADTESQVDAAWRSVSGLPVSNALQPSAGQPSPVGRGRVSDPKRSPHRPCAPLTLASIVPPGVQETVLKELPIQALRLREHLVDELHELGLYRIEQLLSLPRSSLPSRFGTMITDRIDQALGRVPEVLVPERFVEAVRCEWELEHPTADSRVLNSVIERLVERMVEALKQRGEGVLSFQCRLERDTAEPLVLRIGLSQPCVSAEHVLTLLQMRLQRTSIAGNVSHIGLQVSQAASVEVRQRQLFATEQHQDQENSDQLATLIDRLSNRLGVESVVRPELLPDAQPEAAVRYCSPIATEDAEQPAGQILRVPPRPILMDPQPVPLSETESSAAPPLCFRRRGRQYQVARCWGPERIETGWWRGSPVRRDYYRVETTGGRRFWLFRRLDDGHWFLHGAFD